MYSEKFLKAEKQDGSPRSVIRVIVIHDRLGPPAKTEGAV